ncbi:MAG: hypothetical protein PVF77_13510, partial [Anaerolineae bacterium]
MKRQHVPKLACLVLALLCGLIVACGAPPDENPTRTPASTRLPPARVEAGECPDNGSGATLNTGQEIYQVPELAEPAPRRWFRDPVFGTCLVRVTDRSDDLSPGDPSTGMVNEY